MMIKPSTKLVMYRMDYWVNIIIVNCSELILVNLKKTYEYTHELKKNIGELVKKNIDGIKD